MGLQSPAMGMEIATTGGPSSGRETGGSAAQNGHPQTTDPLEKHFKRAGFEIREIEAANIPKFSNRVADVAFCIADDSEPIDDEIKASHRIAVFARGRDDIELSLGEHFDGGGRLLQTEDEAEGVELRNFAVDCRPAGKGVNFAMNRGGRLRDIHVRGVGDSNQKWGCGVYTSVPRGERVVLNGYECPGGARRNFGVPSTEDSIGVYLNGFSDGVLEVKNSVVGPHANNGCYTSGTVKQEHDGKAIIEDSTFFGSDRDQVRVGNDSIVRNCTLFTDERRAGFDNQRCLWARFARGVTVENTTMKSVPWDAPDEVVKIDPTAGETTIRNCDIECRSPNHAARGVTAFSPSDAAGDNTAITIENNRFHGDGSPLDVILIQRGRSQSVIEGNTINVPQAAENIDFRR